MIAKVVLVLNGIIAVIVALFFPVVLDIDYLGKRGEHILKLFHVQAPTGGRKSLTIGGILK